MRTITQAPEPRSLREWKREQQRNAPQNLSYANLPTHINTDIKQALLKGQGHLCAYTQRRITAPSECHIEHVVPQNQAPDLSLDYHNMLACFPSNGGDTSPGYGAPIKSGTHVSLGVNFVSPYAAGCDVRFVFDHKGQIHSKTNDQAAQDTIDCLHLNHVQLVELRQRALSAHGLTLRTTDLRSRRGAPRLTAKQATTLATTVLRADAQNQFEPFCNAISQVSAAYAKRELARSARMKNHP